MNLTDEELLFLHKVEDGAFIFGRYDADLARTIEKKNEHLLQIIPTHELENLGLKAENGKKERPYFGAFLTSKGKEVWKEVVPFSAFLMTDEHIVLATNVEHALSFYAVEEMVDYDVVVDEYYQYGEELRLDEKIFIPFEDLRDEMEVGEIKNDITVKDGEIGVMCTLFSIARGVTSAVVLHR